MKNLVTGGRGDKLRWENFTKDDIWSHPSYCVVKTGSTEGDIHATPKLVRKGDPYLVESTLHLNRIVGSFTLLKSPYTKIALAAKEKDWMVCFEWIVLDVSGGIPVREKTNSRNACIPRNVPQTKFLALGDVKKTPSSFCKRQRFLILGNFDVFDLFLKNRKRYRLETYYQKCRSGNEAKGMLHF